MGQIWDRHFHYTHTVSVIITEQLSQLTFGFSVDDAEMTRDLVIDAILAIDYWCSATSKSAISNWWYPNVEVINQSQMSEEYADLYIWELQ